jgi:hypothetical protein
MLYAQLVIAVRDYETPFEIVRRKKIKEREKLVELRDKLKEEAFLEVDIKTMCKILQAKSMKKVKKIAKRNNKKLTTKTK